MAAIDRKGNIAACVGDDIKLVFTITDPAGAYSWTGATVVTTIVGSGGVASSSNFTTVTATGTLTLTLSDTATTALGAGPFRYAITVTKNGDSQTWLGAVLSLAVPVYAPTTLTVALAITVTTATVALTISGGVAGAEGGTTALTTDGDILTRTAGVPARITRTNLAADSAFTARFASLVNVIGYGAKGDGTTDDTAAIQVAIAAAAVAGGTVYFPQTTGPYMVSTVKMADKVGLQGENVNVTIKKLNGTSGPVITNGAISGLGGAGSSFRDLTIDGNYYTNKQTNAGRTTFGAAAGTDGIGQFPGGDCTGYRGDGVTIDNVRVTNCGRHGINIGDTTAVSTFLFQMQRTWSTYNGGRGIVFSKVWDSWIFGGWTAENFLGNVWLNNCIKIRFYGMQLEGNDDTGYTMGGTTRPAVEVDDTGGASSWLVFHGITSTNHRGSFRIKGAIDGLFISDSQLDASNSNASSGTYRNIEFLPGATTQRNINVHDNNFPANVGSGAVGYHVYFTDPTGAGAYQDVKVRPNLYPGAIGVAPITDHIRYPTTKFGGFNVHAGHGSTHLSKTAQTLTSGSPANASFTTELFDAGDGHDNATNTDRITAAKAGMYRASAHVAWVDNGTGQRICAIQRNGSDIASGKGAADSAGRSATTVSCPVLMVAGDFITLSMFQNSGGNLDTTFVYLSLEPVC